jgi:membrane protease subunit HflC
MNRLPTILVAILVIAVLLSFAMTFQVRFTETAVVTRFEAVVTDREIGPGLNVLRLPWPIERVYKFDKRLQTYVSEPTQLSTADQNTVVVTVFANWRIEDANQFMQSCGTIDSAEKKISDLINGQVRNAISEYAMSDFIQAGEGIVTFDEIENRIRDRVNEQASAKNAQYGIQLVSVGIARLGLPESNGTAVANRMKADREAVSKKLESAGQAEADAITSAALAKAAKISKRAQAYARKIEGEGEQIAAKYYEVYNEYPELATMLKSFETLHTMFSTGENLLILDSRSMSAPFDLLKPLSTGSAGADTSAVQPPAGENRTRADTGAADDEDSIE